MSPRLLIAPKGGREIPSSRYRVHNLVPLLANRGWDVDLLTGSTDRRARVRNLFRDLRQASCRYDVLLVQRPGRRREEHIVLRVASLRARVLAIDVDDVVDEAGPFAWAMRHADLALVGSRLLLEKYRDRVPRTALVATSLDVGLYDRVRADSDVPLIGWIGDGPAYRDSLVRLVRELGAVAPSWRLRIVGTKGDVELERSLVESARALELELVDGLNWEDETEVAREVARYDIGLVPFRNAEGASFKTAQYLAAGVVPLVEAGGEGERHARAALGSQALVVTPGDRPALVEALKLLADPSSLSAMRRAAKAAAVTLFSQEAAAERIDSALRQAIAEAR